MSHDLRPLAAHELDPVIDLHRVTWYGAADADAFRRYYRALLDTPWARRNVAVFGWFEDGALVSSFKVYQLEMLINGHKRACAGIGAVLTLPNQRGRGHASAMIRAAIEGFRTTHNISVLFSQVGPRFYKRLGFFPLFGYKYVAVDEAPSIPQHAPSGNGNGATHRKYGVDAALGAEARPYQPSDLPRLVEIYNLDVSLRKIGLLRTEAYWDHLFTRERLQTELPGTAEGEPRTYVCLSDDRIASYMTFRLLKDRLKILESPAESFRSQSWILHYAVLLGRTESKPKVEAQLPFKANETEVRILVRRDTPLLMLAPLRSGLRPEDFPYAAENFLWNRDRF